MTERTLIKPKEITVKDIDGGEHTYLISRFPALKGREIIAKYPMSNLPKLGQYVQSEAATLELMKFVDVVVEDGTTRPLTTAAMIDNHVPDGETLIKIEFEMLRYNTSFFGIGGSSGFLEGLIQRYLPLITKTLMETLPPSSPQTKQPSKNSGQSTT
jgi:hypothetical protein